MLYLYTALVGIPLVLAILHIYGQASIRLFRIASAPLAIAPIAGLASLLITVYVVGHLQLRALTALLIGIAIAWYARSGQWRQDWQHFLTPSDRLVIAVLLFFSLLFALFNAFSGIITPQGFEMRGTNSVDGFIHLSYAKNIVEQFPPTRPVFANMPLTGYHYFFPLFVAQINLLFGFAVEDILFRITPFILALLYGLSFYLLSTLIPQPKVLRPKLCDLRFLIVLSAYVPYSTLPLIPNFFVGFPGIANPLSFIHNPSTLMAAAFLNAGFYAVVKIKNEWGWQILAGVFIGVLAQTKVYAGMIGLGTLGIFSLIKLAAVTVIPAKAGIHGRFTDIFRMDSGLRRNDVPKLFITTIIAVIITYTTFFLNNANSGSLVWAPFRFFDHFMEQQTFLSMQWPQRKAIFLADNNLIRIILLYVQAIAIFFAIHLGTRIFALITAPAMLRKSFWQNDLNILILIATVLSFLIPTLFIQSISVFDIAQTFWFGATLLVIPSAVGLHQVIQKLRNMKFYVLSSTFLVLCFMLPFTLTYVRESRPYLTGTPDRIVPHDQLKLFAYITEKVLPYEFLFFIPAANDQGELQWSGTPIFPAMTGRSIYFERSGTPFQLNTEGEKRLAAVTTAVRAAHQCDLGTVQQLLTTANTKHLVTTKPISCLTNPELTDNFIETGEYSYYRLK